MIIQNDLNGMETSLAGFLSLLAILSVLSVDKKLTRLRLLSLGIVCGLAFLARADTCFLLILIAFYGLLRWGFRATIIFRCSSFCYCYPLVELFVHPLWHCNTGKWNGDKTNYQLLP